jgi:4-amino-4-deoxy-L-arabinose transferase-like glycosyltransferase
MPLMRDAEASRGLQRTDLLAVGLILIGYVVALLLMPPTRDFAIFDDWAYARTVERIVGGHGFAPSQAAQATLVTHAYWGALFAALFGMSFTSLTIAALAMSLIGSLAFYALLRRLGFSTGLSGLGVAILALNPYYLNLGYSFMTDVTFVSLVLLSCLFYFEGLRSDIRWLWVGGAFGALAFLCRQFGVLVPVAATIYLLLERPLGWRKLFAVLLLPALAVAGYFLWSLVIPTTYSASVTRQELLDFLSPSAWVTRASHFIYLAAFLPGLLVPLWGRVRNWKLVGVLALAMAAVVYFLWQVKFGLAAQGRSAINDLSYSWLTASMPDPTLIYCLGAALTVWLAAGLVERAWPGAISLIRRKRTVTPSDFLYLVPVLLFLVTYLISAGVLDRYWLPILPFLLAGGLVLIKGKPVHVLLAVSTMAVVAIYGIALHLDQYDYEAAQWSAGRWVVSQGVAYDKIKSDYPWDGYYLYDEALQRLGSRDISVIGRAFPPDLIIDPQYVIAPSEQPGYHVVSSYPYFDRLGGSVTRRVLVLKRD